MHFFSINSEKDTNKIEHHIKKGDHIFVLVYMEGCGPCNATRPEWAKLESALKDQYSKNNKVVVADINKDYMSNIKGIGEINGFPTMKYIGNHGSTVEPYENSSVKNKDRSVNSFINWIESKITKMVSTAPTRSTKDVYNRILASEKRHKHRKSTNKHRKRQKGGKWSRKYKSNINCRRPKGFSQRQYCKYGRKK